MVWRVGRRHRSRRGVKVRIASGGLSHTCRRTTTPRSSPRPGYWPQARRGGARLANHPTAGRSRVPAGTARSLRLHVRSGHPLLDGTRHWGEPWSPVRYDGMVFGKPCSQNTCSMNRSARVAASMVVLHGAKWRAFVRRSITGTTQIVSAPCNYGRPVTKSIAISRRGLSGIGTGRDIPKGACRAVRGRWQTWQFFTDRSTLPCIFGQWYVRFKDSSVFDRPGWPAAAAPWCVFSNLRQSGS